MKIWTCGSSPRSGSRNAWTRVKTSTVSVVWANLEKTVTTPEIVYKIHELILEDRRITAKSIAEQLGISRERVGSVNPWRFGHAEALREVGPEIPERGSKLRRFHSSEQIWNFFGAIQMISCRSRLKTMGETWLYHYEPETKQQSMESRHRNSPHPKNSECKTPLEKFSPRFFWDQDSILLIDCLPKGQTINAECQLSLPVQLKDILKGKRRRKVTKGVLFLHDNAPAQRALATQKKLAYLGLHFLDRPPYSPDLTPSDYRLFPGLNKQLKYRHFSSDAEVIFCRGDLVGRTNFWIFLSGL